MKQRSAHLLTVTGTTLAAVTLGGVIGTLSTPSFPTDTPVILAATTLSPTSAPMITPTLELTASATATASPATAAVLLPTATAEPLPPEPTAAEQSAPAEATPEVAPPEATPTPMTPAFVEYTVQRGDLLYVIARQFNTTPQNIIDLNPGINPNSLRIGTVLRIPAPTP